MNNSPLEKYYRQCDELARTPGFSRSEEAMRVLREFGQTLFEATENGTKTVTPDEVRKQMEAAWKRAETPDKDRSKEELRLARRWKEIETYMRIGRMLLELACASES